MQKINKISKFIKKILNKLNFIILEKLNFMLK